MTESAMEHRKFLKTYADKFELGTFFPDEVTLVQNAEPIDLSWLSNTEHGAVLFFTSAYCEACNSDIFMEAVRKYPDFSYMMFYEHPKSPVSGLDKLGIQAVPFQIDLVMKQMNVNMVPYLIVLNKVGQAVAAGVVNTLPMVEALMGPLVRALRNQVK